MKQGVTCKLKTVFCEKEILAAEEKHIIEANDQLQSLSEADVTDIDIDDDAR